MRRLAGARPPDRGTAWTERSLVESGVLYPPSATGAKDRLRHYASRFPITQVDSTFYHPPAERTAALWAERSPAGFVFDVKAFRLLTQHPTPPSELWSDLRASLPAEQAAKRSRYARDLPRELVAEVLRRFAAALEPLRAAGRLGEILFQPTRYVYMSALGEAGRRRAGRLWALQVGAARGAAAGAGLPKTNRLIALVVGCCDCPPP